MRRLCVIACALLLIFAGCSMQQGTENSSGEPLSFEEQQSLYQDRLDQQGEPDLNAKGTVYWTSGGSKYHKDAHCSYIANAKELQSGTVAQAVNYGASEPCSRCAHGG